MENSRPLNCGGLILDRFHSMVKFNDDIVQIYDELLSELTINSKPIITELTMIAGEQREYAEGIADAIMARILEVPVDKKLPSLYLLDSIAKNIGREYVRYFAVRLPEVFCEAYNQVHANMHPAMRHLFRTWSQVFPSSVLRKIEDELQFSTSESQRPANQVNMKNSESPSPRPSGSIHVNPKYLEQFQNSATMGEVHTQKDMHTAEFVDGTEGFASESPKGWSGASPKFHDTGYDSGDSSSLRGYRNSAVRYGDYDINNSEARLPQLGRSKTVSLQSAPVRPSISGVEGSVHRSNVKGAKPLSPSRSASRKSESPIYDRILTDGSPWRAGESATQPHSLPGFGLGRAINQNGRPDRAWLPVVGASQPDASMLYDTKVEYHKKHPRELINAYGNYRGKDTCLEKFPKLQRINVNSMNGDFAAKNWRSFEEEEYMWEDMSPTLADRSRLNSLPALGSSSESLNGRVVLSQPAANIHKHDFRGNNQHGEVYQHPVYDPTIIVDDRIPVTGLGHGLVHKGGQNEQHHYRSPYHVQEPGKSPYNFQHISGELSSWRWRPQPPPVSVITAANGQKRSRPYDSPPDVEVAYRPHQRLSSIHSGSLNAETSGLEPYLELRPFSPPPASTMWPPVHKSQPLPLLPAPPVKSRHSHIESSKPVSQGPNPCLFLPHQQFESADGKPPIPQHAGLMQINQQSQELSEGMRIYNQGAHGRGYIPSLPAQLSSHLLAQPQNHLQMHGQVTMDSSPDKISMLTSSGTMHSMSETSSLVHGGVMPPLPPGPPPGPSHMGTASQNTSSISGSPASAFSGLISTLMAQGVISLTPAAPPKDSVGLEFNAERLKVRHESAISALYTDLPRQCTTCGLRFKCQEEHRNHMDWHVTKNRISKNRKQKPSRKWFVNTKEWLSGAETVGTEVVPFLPTEVVIEKKEDKEMTVPADENQTVCALCGESFEDFYSDDAEEWMYKGAVYLNAPIGNFDGLDGSQLGPIVHAKCRSDSSEGS